MSGAKGASPDGDRATHEQSQQAVSAVPVGIPSAEWPHIEWDEGYPVGEDDDFAAFDSLPLDFRQAAHFLLRELPFAAENCCAWCEVKDGEDEYDPERKLKIIEFSTGGWSGAESVIGLIESRFDLRHFMLSWHRGGHYVFEIPERLIAQGMSAGTAETAQQAQGDSPPARSATPMRPDTITPPTEELPQ